MALGSGPLVPPSWTVGDWYFDPGNASGCASNSNSCTSQTCGPVGVGPCVLVNEVIDHRWGTPSPTLGQTTTLHLMSSETPGQESITLSPLVVGSNATTSSLFVIDGTLGMTLAAPQFGAGVINSKTRGGPGQLLTVGSMPAQAAVGQMVQNLSVSNASYAFIDGLAAGVGTMTQPLDATATVADSQQPANEVDTWTANDPLRVWNLPALNLKVFMPSGGDASFNSGNGYYSTAVLENFEIPDVAGAPGFSTATFMPAGIGLTAINFRSDPFLNFLGGNQEINASCYNCWLDGGAEVQYAGLAAGAVCTNNVLGVAGGVAFTRIENLASIDGDLIIHGELLVKAGPYSIVGLVYVADATGSNGLGIIHGAIALLEPSDTVNVVSGNTVQVWGPGKFFTEAPMSVVMNGSGETWVTALTLAGGYSLDGATTATMYDAGAWTDNIPLTPAALDLHNTLQNPRTGSRFTLGN